jgi:hypothetical protein
MRLRPVSTHFAAMLFLAITTVPFAYTQTAPQNPQRGQPQLPMGGKGGHPTSNITAQVAGPLTITYGDKSAEWTPQKLDALPQTTITVFNGHANANQTYSGVPLIELLAKLGVPDKPRGKDLRLYIVAEGSDGYKVVYSIGELSPDLHDGTVIVADKLAGQPIGQAGPLQVVATGEKHPARWVRNLIAIHVRTAE